LFVTQIAESFASDDVILPGSAGVALALAQKEEAKASAASAEALTPILLVSGPSAAGRSELVERLIREGNGRFVPPRLMDRNKEGATFERLEQRDDFLEIDPTGRFGLTKEGILTAAKPTEDAEQVVVVDADVDLARKLTKLSGARLIGVWVGLDTVEKFESRLQAQVDSGKLQVPEDESRESVVRSKVKEIVKDIEYGIVSGIFEFTILNDDPENSFKELKEAAEYCFK
jgi:guanylate kinase